MLSDNFGEIFQLTAYLEKDLKEKCWLEHYQQLSFKYFVKPFLITKFLSNILYIQKTISHEA